MKRLLASPIVACYALMLTMSASTAHAQVTNAALSAFPVGPAQVTFTGLVDGAEMNGVTSGGVLFSYSLGNGHIISDGGPGATNNISPLNLVSSGNNTGVLTLTLPSLSKLFGFGFALLTDISLANAVSATVFNGATNLGSLSYGSAPDPFFTGGFAGLQSVTAFDRVQLVFNSTQASAFAIDNIRFSSTSVVPEPSAIALCALGLAGIAFARRRHATLRVKRLSDVA